MDTFLLLTGFCLMLLGVVGSFLPVLPGSICSWIGLLLLYFTNAIAMNYWILGITLLVTIGVSTLEYIIPAKGTKKFGGSSYGIWGTNIGMLIGFFVPIPFGFIIGAFVGAFVGELYFDSQDKTRALKAATGSLLGFLASSFVEFMVCVIFLGIFLFLVWQNRSLLF
jgi:uncharacterized protein YqgC (DUF456 family)